MLLSIQLRRKVGSRAALCEIDAAVVQALDDCSDDPFLFNYRSIAWLMGQLADNWERHGVPSRADEVYGKAYALYGIVGATEFDILRRIWLLRRWATLKLRSGDEERAREMAYIQTELGRWDYERGSPPRAELVDALEFQADLLEKIGKHDEASAARKEAEAMADIYTICPGFCDSSYTGTYGGVREKR